MKIHNKKVLEHIQQAKKGNQISFNFLLDTFWVSVYNYQLSKIKNDNEAEDITIRTFSKAFNKIDTFDETYQFKTWLIAISKNIYIDSLRKKNNLFVFNSSKEEEAFKIIDNAPSAEDNLITEQNLAKLLRDIKKLKPKYQEIINLRFFQELSYKEISDKIGEPMNNVKIKLLRAKRLLAVIINKT